MNVPNSATFMTALNQRKAYDEIQYVFQFNKFYSKFSSPGLKPSANLELVNYYSWSANQCSMQAYLRDKHKDTSKLDDFYHHTTIQYELI